MRWHLALVLACGCHSVAGDRAGDDDVMLDAAASGGGSGAPSVFDPSITNVVIEIDYETGKQPYTGPIIGFGDTFEPTQANLDRLFAGTKTLTVPTMLAAMQDVGTIADEELTIADIQALAAQHRDVYDSETRRSYYVIFVSGSFADANGPQHFVLGYSIGNTIAIFKDVVNATDNVLAPNVVRYVEQSTLIHELAHSIGLVDNGLAMVTPHEDAAHRPHCDNPECVMYWQNDATQDAARFAEQKLLTGSSILFDAHCLADVDAQTGGP